MPPVLGALDTDDEEEDLGIQTPKFKAFQLTYQHMQHLEVTVKGPLRGSKQPREPWTFELELESHEHIVGMYTVPSVLDFYLQTSQGKV